MDEAVDSSENLSRTKPIGSFVLNRVFDPDSAPVLSDKLRIRMGNLHAGKHLLSRTTMAICASVS